MRRNYQREERDWRRQQPSFQEEGRWSTNPSDDDFTMGLGQESRGSRGEDYARRGGPEFGSSGSQGGSRWQRSQFRGAGSEFEGTPQYGPDRDTGWEGWNQRYEGLGGRGWYEGVQSAMHRGEGPFTGRGPKNYKRSDDRIEEDINDRLTRHGNVDATEIEVTVQNGEVTLRGFVDNRPQKRMAEDVADAVSGVRDVINQIKVKLRGESGEGEAKHETEAPGTQQRKAG